jgi:TolA-binding protein
MHCLHSQYWRLFCLIAVVVAESSYVQGEAPAHVKAKQSVSSSPQQVETAQVQDPPEQVPALPDDGPRSEEGPHAQGQGIAELAWQEGYAAYKKGVWSEAQRLFETIVSRYPESAIASSAQAFLAEMLLQKGGSGANRQETIRVYKKLLRDYPQSSNARRAEWRIADLYLEQGWLQEAQATYEQAMAHSLQFPLDGNRALLGLGYTYLVMRRWSDAEHAFANLRKRSNHDLLLRHGNMGLAHALFRQQRLAEAHTYYEFGYRRWPETFRLEPSAVHRYAMTLAALHRDAAARDLMLLFYNLYPRHADAPTALLYVADNALATSNAAKAELFYALIPTLYTQTPQGTAANMRMASLHADRMGPAGENWVGLTVNAMMRSVPMPDQTDAWYQAMLRDVANQQADTPLGSEALFRLGQYYEKGDDTSRTVRTYHEAALRGGGVSDPWPMKASERLSALVKPWIEAALHSRDDMTVVSLFHRLGPNGGQLYAHSPALLEIAEAHRRLEFSLEALRLYQQAVKENDPTSIESALLGLGKTYLGQQDPTAARKVFERYRFQFQPGRHESEVLRLLVEAMTRQKDLHGLLHLCRQWLVHHPTHGERPFMYRQLAETLGQLDKPYESALAYEEAFKAGAGRSVETLLAYADTLSRLDRHQQAIAGYLEVLDLKPAAHHLEWIHLQTAKHWYALKQYDRATVALAEVGESDNSLIMRVATVLKRSLQVARRSGEEEEL